MGASQGTDPQVGMQDRLAEARRQATQAQLHLNTLTSRITTAIRAEDFALAQELKDQVPDARAEYGQHEATAKALEMVLADLEQQRQAHDAQIAAEHRKVAGAKNLERAILAERELMDELMGIRATVTAGLGAVQETLRRGYEIESAVRQVRNDAARARVETGEADSVPGRLSAPNVVSSLVERSPALTAILHGKVFP
jgi:hypothetical protein